MEDCFGTVFPALSALEYGGRGVAGQIATYFKLGLEVVDFLLQAAVLLAYGVQGHGIGSNPALYNLLTNGILQGRLDFDRSKGTCRAIADKMLDVAGGQMGWNKIAEGQAMSQAVKSGNTDAVAAVSQVEKQGGNDGITWVGGNKAGGSGQKPINVVGDVTRAGYNLLNGRSAADSSSISPANCNNGTPHVPRRKTTHLSTAGNQCFWIH